MKHRGLVSGLKVTFRRSKFQEEPFYISPKNLVVCVPAAVARWAEVGDDRKAEYQKKCDAEKAEYDKAMAKYRAQQN